MITLRQLEALRFVIKYHTVTEASKMMNISQPALSQLITNLEHETGLALFRRERKRLYPTDEAFLLSHHAEEIFSGLRQVEMISKEIRTRRTGSLNVMSAMILGREFLPGQLAKFIRDKPDVEVRFGIGSQARIRDLVSGRRCDVGFGFWGKSSPGIELVNSYRFPLVCVMPKDDPLVVKSEISISDFEGRELICLCDAGSMQEKIERALEKANVRYRNRLNVQQTELACALVGKGFGISIVNPFAATEYEERGLLVAKPMNLKIEVELCGFVPAGKERSLLTKDFIEVIDEALKTFKNSLPQN